jgi:hypothetical protein
VPTRRPACLFMTQNHSRREFVCCIAAAGYEGGHLAECNHAEKASMVFWRG